MNNQKKLLYNSSCSVYHYYLQLLGLPPPPPMDFTEFHQNNRAVDVGVIVFSPIVIGFHRWQTAAGSKPCFFYRWLLSTVSIKLILSCSHLPLYHQSSSCRSVETHGRPTIAFFIFPVHLKVRELIISQIVLAVMKICGLQYFIDSSFYRLMHYWFGRRIFRTTRQDCPTTTLAVRSSFFLLLRRW